MPLSRSSTSGSTWLPLASKYVPPNASFLASVETSPALICTCPGLPPPLGISSTSSKLIQLPALALETKLIVHWPAVTVAVTEICTQVLPGVWGMVVRGSGLAPQFRSAM
jgi:hypothetical protein